MSEGDTCATSVDPRPSGIGSVVSSLLNGRQIDYYYRREERRVGGDYRKKGEEFRVEYTRLRCIAPFMA